MKIHQPSLRIDLTVAIGLNLLTFASIIWFSHFKGDFYLINWGSLALVLATFLFKKYQVDISDKSPYATLQIMLFQIALLVTFTGICQFIGPTSLQKITHTDIHLGLFPWATMTLIAIAFRLLAQRKKTDISLVDMLSSVLPIKQGSPVWSTCFLFLRQTTLTALALTLTLLILSLLKTWQPFTNTLTIRQLILSLIPAIVLFYRPLTKNLMLFTRQRHWLFISLVLFSLILAITLIGAAQLLHGLTQPTQMPTLLTWFYKGFNTNQLAPFFYRAWWLAWSAMGGLFIAHRSRHLSLKKMILISFIVPIALILLAQLPGLKPAIKLSPNIIYLSIPSCLLLCWLLFQKDTLPLFMLVFYPFKLPPKHRPYEIHLKKCLKTILLMLFFAIPLGRPVAVYFTCLIGLPLLITLPFIMIAIFKK